MTPEEIEAQKQNAAALKASMAPTQEAARPVQTYGTTTPTGLTADQVNQRKTNTDALTQSAASVQAGKDAITAAQSAPVKGTGGVGDATAAGIARNDAIRAAQNSALDTASAGVDRAQQGTQAAQVNSDTGSTANFVFNGQQTAARQDADTALKAAQDYRNQIIDQAKGGIPDIGRLIDADQKIKAATRSTDVADINAQSSNAGVDRVDQQGVQSGIGGLFGLTQAQSNFTAKVGNNNAVLNDKDNLNALSDTVAGRDIKQMTAASSTAAQLDKTQSNQARDLSLDSRGQQQDVANILRKSAMGDGPSAAQAQLQAGTDASISANLALAKSARGGNQANALRQAMMANGTTIQQSANQAAQLKAQEQQAATSQLAGVTSNIRGQDLTTQAQDLGAATTNAGFTQQTALANSAQAQDASKTNLQSSVDQQAQKDSFVQQNILAGMSADQAEIASQRQMAIANADLQARQEAARNGQTYAAGAAGLSAIGTGVSTVGNIIASAAKPSGK